MSNRVFYGLSCKQEVVWHARKICSVIGGGVNNKAIQMLVETAQQETHMGSFPERHPYKLGVGLCQIDKIAFDDIKRRTPKHVSDKVREYLGITLRQVEHRDLAFSPLKSLLFCRLFYRLRPELIPDKMEGRAEYWKKHYNTAKGKGTAQEYIHNASRIEVSYNA